MIGSSARFRVVFARFRAEASIMGVGPAFGGAARPEGRPLASPSCAAEGPGAAEGPRTRATTIHCPDTSPKAV
jgi:hypothetical protein